MVWGGWWLLHWRTGRPLTRRALATNAWPGGALLVAWMIFWLARNLPGWPLLWRMFRSMPSRNAPCLSPTLQP